MVVRVRHTVMPRGKNGVPWGCAGVSVWWTFVLSQVVAKVSALGHPRSYSCYKGMDIPMSQYRYVQTFRTLALGEGHKVLVIQALPLSSTA